MRFDEILGLLPRVRFGIDFDPGLELLVLELLFWGAVILLTFALFRFRPVLLEKAETGLRRISQFKRFWLLAFALGVIFARLALLPLIPVPTPRIHDEYSYLLAADTFSHGRLTNPSNAMWQHFESFHINMQPTYQSMYPPGQGLALALGQVLTGVPWIGVLLSTAVMCSAIYWMLLGWMPAPWAWLGGAFACARFGVSSYWVNSYLGGSVAAIGGVLVLGALPRFWEKPRAGNGLALAAGLVILANSRPFEGFLFSIPILISVAVAIIKNSKLGWPKTLRAVLPAMALLATGVAWMAYYNWRGTGNPLLMPYTSNWNTYHFSKPFFFQAPNSVPTYHHQSMRALYVYWELPNLLIWRYSLGALERLRASVYYSFYLWPFLLLVAPGVVAMWRSRLRVVLFSLALVAGGLFAQRWQPQPHYAAPAVGAVFLAILYSLRHFRNSNSECALWGSRALAIVLALWMITPIAEKIRDPFVVAPTLSNAEETENRAVQYKAFPMPREIERGRILSTLRTMGGKHLIIVHYPPSDIPSQEWVYNEADINDAKVIWARDMGYLKNKELLDYYPDRRAWYVDHGAAVVRLFPYDPAVEPLQRASDGSPYGVTLPPISSALQGLVPDKTAPSPQAKPQYSAAVAP